RPAAIAGIDPLRREGQEEVPPGGEPARLEARAQDLLRGAGIRRRLEHHELPAVDDGGDRGGRRHDEGDVGLARLTERRGHAYDDRVGLPQRSGVTGGAELPGLDEARDRLGRYVL